MTTVTVTLPPAVTVAPLSLKLTLPPKEQVHVLLREMRASGLFPEEMLAEWEAVYLGDFETVTTEEGRIAARDALGDLITDVFGSLRESSAKALDLYKLATNILALFLKPSETVGGFIEGHEEESARIELLLEKLTEIENFLKSAFESLGREADAKSAEMQSFVREIQTRLTALNAERTHFSETMHHKVDECFRQMEELCHSLEATGLKVAETLGEVARGHAACAAMAEGYADKMALFAKKV